MSCFLKICKIARVNQELHKANTIHRYNNPISYEFYWQQNKETEKQDSPRRGDRKAIAKDLSGLQT